jgi:hypothetical protein
MTLNITVAARWMMTQSSDFRLTGLTRSGVPLSDVAQKQVVLHYFEWSGLVCYTGIARWGRHDTGAWLEDVLTHEPGQRSARQVVQRLAAEGSKWLSSVPTSYRRHSFTMVAFERRIPHVYVISNFQRGDGRPLSQPLDHFEVDRIRPRGPRCFVTGWADAVTPDQREALQTLLASGTPPESMRLAVALASRDAAQRACGTVGTSCVAAHLLPDGSGEAQVFGNLEGEFIPAMIVTGTNVASFVPPAKTATGASGPTRLVGVTWQSFQNGSAMLGAFRELSNQVGDGWPPDPD